MCCVIAKRWLGTPWSGRWRHQTYEKKLSQSLSLWKSSQWSSKTMEKEQEYGCVQLKFLCSLRIYLFGQAKKTSCKQV